MFKIYLLVICKIKVFVNVYTHGMPFIFSDVFTNTGTQYELLSASKNNHWLNFHSLALERLRTTEKINCLYRNTNKKHNLEKVYSVYRK